MKKQLLSACSTRPLSAKLVDGSVFQSRELFPLKQYASDVEVAAATIAGFEQLKSACSIAYSMQTGYQLGVGILMKVSDAPPLNKRTAAEKAGVLEGKLYTPLAAFVGEHPPTELATTLWGKFFGPKTAEAHGAKSYVVLFLKTKPTGFASMFDF